MRPSLSGHDWYPPVHARDDGPQVGADLLCRSTRVGCLAVHGPLHVVEQRDRSVRLCRSTVELLPHPLPVRDEYSTDILIMVIQLLIEEARTYGSV